MHLVYFREKEFIGRKELFKSKSCHLWWNVWERMAANGYSLLFHWVLLLLFQCQVQNCTQQLLLQMQRCLQRLELCISFFNRWKKGRKKTSLCSCKTPFYSLRLCFQWSTQASTYFSHQLRKEGHFQEEWKHPVYDAFEVFHLWLTASRCGKKRTPK